MDQRKQSTLARKATGQSRDAPADRPRGVDPTTARKTGRVQEPRPRRDLPQLGAGQPQRLAQRGHGTATKSVEGRRPLNQAYARVDRGLPGQVAHPPLRKQAAPFRHDRGQQPPVFGTHQALTAASRTTKSVLLPPWASNDSVSPNNRRRRGVNDIGGRTNVLPANNLLGRRQQVHHADIADARWVIGPDMSIRRAGVPDQANDNERYFTKSPCMPCDNILPHRFALPLATKSARKREVADVRGLVGTVLTISDQSALCDPTFPER